MAYDCITDVGATKHSAVHERLQQFGFPSNPANKKCQTLREVERYHQAIMNERERLPYWTDGIVVNVDDIDTFRLLGVIGKAPRGSVAYKFPAQQATTVIEDIKVQVGRTGALTPVAWLKPVSVAGTTVARATLHNADEIERLDVRLGDTVVIQKAGDIIPEVVQVITKLRPKHSRPYHFPKHCPVCGTVVTRRDQEVVWYCPNRACPGRHHEQLHHFTSKSGLDIRGLGPKIIDQLTAAGLINNFADIFKLKPEDLKPLERFAEISSGKMVQSIQTAAKAVPLAKLIYALGIRHVGEETALALAQQFGSLAAVRAASLEELRAVPDVGQVMADSVYQYFHDPKNQAMLNELLPYLKITAPLKQPARSAALAGKTFVLTGTLDSYTRDAAKRLIRERGGKISSSVSRATDYVVVGAEPGSKYDRAKILNIPILTEPDFTALIK